MIVLNTPIYTHIHIYYRILQNLEKSIHQKKWIRLGDIRIWKLVFTIYVQQHYTIIYYELIFWLIPVSYETWRSKIANESCTQDLDNCRARVYSDRQFTYERCWIYYLQFSAIPADHIRIEYTCAHQYSSLNCTS